MKETVLITGAHGLIARHLAAALETEFHIKLLSTNPDRPNMYKWDVETGYIDPKATENVDHIIHLAGAKFYDGAPLTDERKAVSIASRAGTAGLLLRSLHQMGRKIKSFSCASAAGYYDFDAGVKLIDEDGPKAATFSAALCEKWEAAAIAFKQQGVAQRVLVFRSAAVLAADGGILSQFRDLYKSDPALLGKQRTDKYLPWIHITDLVCLFAAGLKNENFSGIYNNASDQPVNMAMFVDAMSRLLENEMMIANHHYDGVRISSARIKSAGFAFKYPTLQEALKDLITGL